MKKLRKEEMKKCLYGLFNQFGKVVDVVSLKSETLRGQAWIVYEDVTSATNALRAMQDFPFFGKEMRVEYAKTKSDAAAKLDGSWHRDKRTRKITLSVAAEDKNISKEEGGEKPKPSAAASASDVGEPNSILFLENLPEATNEAMLGVLFQQFPGYKEARLVPGKPGIAFIEFESELQSGVALSGLQGFKITPQHSMRIIYAKR
ncbi:hypothetical protein Ndes2437B_g06767 [Nannochloris sp. 'desiccata']